MSTGIRKNNGNNEYHSGAQKPVFGQGVKKHISSRKEAFSVESGFVEIFYTYKQLTGYAAAGSAFH